MFCELVKARPFVIPLIPLPWGLGRGGGVGTPPPPFGTEMLGREGRGVRGSKKIADWVSDARVVPIKSFAGTERLISD